MDTIRLEAEDLILSTYLPETRNIASGGEVITLFNAAGTEGTATSTFTGVSGTYDVVVVYFDENDGQATLSLQVGDDQDTWTLDQDFGIGGVRNGNRVERTALSQVNIENGDAITLTGIVDAAEFARVDYIEFIPVDIAEPGLSIDDVTVNETDGTATFTVSLSAASTTAITVDFATTAGSATEGSDYSNTTGGLTFVAGQTTQNIVVDITNDDIVEANESFTLNLTNAVGASITDGTGVATIISDDSDAPSPPPTTIRLEAEEFNLDTYIEETRNIASDGEVITLFNAAGTEGTATSTFTGASGTYDVVVVYFDENDGQATLSLQVGDDQDTWTLDQDFGIGGVRNGNRVERTALSQVNIENGDAITLTGIVNAAEFARVDYIEFIPADVAPSPTPTTIRLEAEELNLDTYIEETRNIASEGEVISLFNAAGTEGTATSTFTGVTGTYDVIVVYHDENDGQATLTLQVGDDQDTWTLDQNLGSGGVTNGNRVERTALSQVNLTNGDAITLTGIVDAAEFARVDYIEFIPVGASAPVNGSANNDTLEGTSNNDFINALGGNDVITPGAGNNSIDGGTGNDTVSYDYGVAGVTVDLSTGLATRKFTTFTDRLQKILPLGSSNTRGFPNLAENGGYRTQLYTNLSADFNIDFIGRLASGPGTIDRDHEGRGGATLDELADGGVPDFEQPAGVTPPEYGNIEAALAGNPDVVLLYPGANDLNAGDDVDTVISDLEALIGRISAALPETHIVVGSLTPNTSTPEIQEDTIEVNSRIPGLINSLAAAGQKVVFADLFNAPGLGPSDFLADGFHLTASGYDKLASVWEETILNLEAGQDNLNNIENLTGSAFDDSLTGDADANNLVGLGGNDQLFGGGGTDTLTGGLGSDIFGLATDAATDVFTDFSLGEGDLIGLSDSLQFTDLAFQGSDILLGGQALATLTGVDTTTLTEDEFTII